VASRHACMASERSFWCVCLKAGLDLKRSAFLWQMLHGHGRRSRIAVRVRCPAIDRASLLAVQGRGETALTLLRTAFQQFV
jgi:hypothetical protein